MSKNAVPNACGPGRLPGHQKKPGKWHPAGQMRAGDVAQTELLRPLSRQMSRQLCRKTKKQEILMAPPPKRMPWSSGQPWTPGPRRTRGLITAQAWSCGADHATLAPSGSRGAPSKGRRSHRRWSSRRPCKRGRSCGSRSRWWQPASPSRPSSLRRPRGARR